MGQLLFKKCFFDAIRCGTKRTTIRRWKSARLRAGQRAFVPGLGWLAVESVETVADLDDLCDADARADGFESLELMKRALHELYPDQSNDDDDGRRWFKVAFHPVEDAGVVTSVTMSSVRTSSATTAAVTGSSATASLVTASSRPRPRRKGSRIPKSRHQ